MGMRTPFCKTLREMKRGHYSERGRKQVKYIRLYLSFSVRCRYAAQEETVGPETPLTSEDLRGDLIQPGHPLFGIIWINRERMSGAPCFAGTRVPIKNLFDYLEGGEPLDEFLDGFPRRHPRAGGSGHLAGGAGFSEQGVRVIDRSIQCEWDG